MEPALEAKGRRRAFLLPVDEVGDAYNSVVASAAHGPDGAEFRFRETWIGCYAIM